MRISQWLWLPAMVSTSRTISQPGDGTSTMNAVVAAWGTSGSSSVRASRMANRAPRAPLMNHLCPLIDPLVAVGHGPGPHEGGVRSRHLGLGHGEARPHRCLRTWASR